MKTLDKVSKTSFYDLHLRCKNAAFLTKTYQIISTLKKVA